MRNPNGYGGVCKLPGNRRRPYRARVTVGWQDREDGSRLQKYTTIGYYYTQEDALVALAEYNQSPFDLSQRAITFGEVYRQWTPRQFERYPSTRRVTEGAMALCRDLWDRPMRDLRPPELQRVLTEMDDKSRAYQAKVRSLMHRQFEWCIKNDILQKDYSQFLDLPREESESSRTVFTREEVQRLWQLYRTSDPVPGEPEKYRGSGLIASILLLLYTGMRVGELLAVESGDVHLKERYIDLHGTKTKAARRLVPLHREIVPVATGLFGSGRLIKGPDGPLTYAQYKYSWFDSVMRGLGMSHNPHDTRHTFISGLDTAGASRSVQKFIVGHSLSRDVTDRYTHKNVQELIKAVDMLMY